MERMLSCAANVSVRKNGSKVIVTRIDLDDQGRCVLAQDAMELEPDAAYALFRGLRWALELVKYLPTDEDFEEYRTHILEEMADEVPVEEACATCK